MDNGGEIKTRRVRDIFFWCLYDFANSIVSITFFLYFAQWLVFDKGVSDLWFNLIFVFSSILLISTAPVIAQITDLRGVKLPGLRLSTHLAALFYILTAIAVVFFASPWWAYLSYIFALFFYLLSFCFYNALLVDVADADRLGTVSGLGQLANWLGQITGVLIALPFITGFISFPEIGSGRVLTFLPAALIYYALSLPMLYLFQERTKRSEMPISFFGQYRGCIRQFIALCSLPGVGWFLLAFLLINDATMTFANNFPIYTQAVFGVDDQVKSILTLGVLLSCSIGSYLSGRLSDRFTPLLVLRIIVLLWVIILPLIAVQDRFVSFAFLLVSAGLLHGAVWTVSRALLFELLPLDRLNLGSSYYTLTERFSTLIGPLGWSATLAIASGLGAEKYRLALLTLTVFLILGYFALSTMTRSSRRV